MGAAELAVLLVLGGACYLALAPLRRALERRLLRRQARRRHRGHRTDPHPAHDHHGLAEGILPQFSGSATVPFVNLTPELTRERDRGQ